MKRFLPFALLLLGGCFATASPMFLPDGSSGYRISCDNYMGTMADCIQKAGDLCGANGYQVFDQNGRLKPDDTQNQAVIAAINNSTSGTSKSGKPDTSKSMFIKCKSNDMPLRLTPAPTPQVESTPAQTDSKPIPLQNNGGR